MLLEYVHDRIRDFHWIIRGTVYMLLIFAIEYSTGWLIKYFVGVAPWTYSNSFAVDHLIRLDYAPGWFALGLMFERVHDFLDDRLLLR